MRLQPTLPTVRTTPVSCRATPDPDHGPLQRDRRGWWNGPGDGRGHSVPDRTLHVPHGQHGHRLGTCTANTTANAAVPGAVKDGKRAIVEIGQITITDGGPDGIVGTTPNTLFEVQGIFIP